jgi:hypothetical protein
MRITSISTKTQSENLPSTSLENYRFANLLSFILSRVRGTMTNNHAFWIGLLDLLDLFLQFHLITITYNNSNR